jgi:hypothetical protein
VAALAVFHDEGGGRLRRFLKPGFRHCFCAVTAGPYWIVVDARRGLPAIDVVADASFDLAGFYRGLGYAVARFDGAPRPPRAPVAFATCVGAVKRVLGIRAPFAVTPYQLWRRLGSHSGKMEERHVFAVRDPQTAGAAAAAADRRGS